MFSFSETTKYKKDRKYFEKLHSSYKPTNPKSLEEFFNLTKDLGVLVAIQTKNTIYVRTNGTGIYVPPEISVLAGKFDLNITFGGLRPESNIYYARAKRHAIKIYE
jgi:hypothetical protein